MTVTTFASVGRSIIQAQPVPLSSRRFPLGNLSLPTEIDERFQRGWAAASKEEELQVGPLWRVAACCRVHVRVHVPQMQTH